MAERGRAIVMSKPFVPACLAGALLVRLVWIFAVDARPVDDFSWYWQRAIDLSEGRGLVDRGRPTAYWPVGYPLLLAGVFKVAGVSLLAAQVTNVALYLAAMLLTVAIARRMLGSEIAARLVLLLMALHPNHVVYVSLTGTEILFLVLLQLGVLLLLKSDGRLPAAAAAGIVFGLASLTRPQAALLPAWLIGVQALRRRRRPSAGRLIGSAAALHLAMLVTLTPWTIRNYRVFGSFVFVATSGGTNLLIGNNPNATGGYGAVAADPEADDEKRRDELSTRMAVGHILEHPWSTLALVPRKIWHLYAKDVEGLYWVEVAMGRGAGPPIERPLWALKLAAQAWYVALLFCFAASIPMLLRRPGPGASGRPWDLGLWVTAYFTLIFCVLFGGSRFHFPLVPYFQIYAAAWIALGSRSLDSAVRCGALGDQARAV